MRSIAAIDIAGEYLTAVEMRAGQTDAPPASFVEKLPEPLTPANSTRLADWLRKLMTAHSFSASQAVCTISRNQVSFRAIEVPPCLDSELPAMVALTIQGEAEPRPAGEPVLDFQAGPSTNNGRQVAAATASTALIDAITGMLHGAGLTCEHVSLRPFASQFAWQKGTPAGADEPVLLVVPSAGDVEFSLWRRGQLLLCRSVFAGEDGQADGRVAAELRRTIAALGAQEPRYEVRTIAICGSENSPVVQAAARMPGLTATSFLPGAATATCDDAQLAQRTAAIGAAQRELDSADWPIDFLHAKKPVVVPDRTKPMLAIIASLIAIAAISAFLVGRQRLSTRDGQISAFTEQRKQLDQELADYTPMLKRHQALKDWKATDVHWLYEVNDLARSFPSTEKAFLTGFDARARSGFGPPVLTIEGRATSPEVVTTATRTWAEDLDDHYVVLPARMEPSEDEPKQFPVRFTVELGIRRLESQKYEQRAANFKEKESAPAAQAEAKAGEKTSDAELPSQWNMTPEQMDELRERFREKFGGADGKRSRSSRRRSDSRSTESDSDQPQVAAPEKSDKEAKSPAAAPSPSATPEGARASESAPATKPAAESAKSNP